MILLTLLLGVSIFYIASTFWGPVGGLAALGFYVLDPNITAHGHLITTDIGVTLGFLWTVFLFWKFLAKPNWQYILLLSFAFSFTLLAKFTSVILYPTLFILLLYYGFSKHWKFIEYWKIISKISSSLNQ